MTGQPCPAIAMVQAQLRVVSAPGLAPGRDWRAICPGWTWPGNLARTLDMADAVGTAVVLDVRATSWVGSGQRGRLVEVLAYASTHPDAIVWR